LFRAAAHGETIHALRHFRNMGEIKSTQENLQAAIAGETYEFTQMYPSFVEDAKTEGERPAEKGFADANAVEKIHANLYQEALDNLGKPGEEFDYYVCPICGYVHAKGAPERCPVCNTPGSKFEKMS
jgi:rubrerythrin